MSETSDSTQNDDHGSVYDRCDAAYLRQLQEASGMDETQLARIACLSLAQVRQLAAGGDSLFYSSAVKRQAYKRLLLILGAPPPSQVASAEGLSSPVYDPAPPRQTIDDIVALSERHQYLEHRPWLDFMRDLRLRVVRHRQPLAAFSFLLVAVVLLVTNWPHVDRATSELSQTTADTLKTATLMPQTSKAELRKVEPESKSESNKAETPPTEKTANKEESAPGSSAAPSLTTNTAVVSNANKTCAYRADKLPEVLPPVATKEGRYVYLVSPTNADVCVVDGNRQATSLSLRAGEGRSVYGSPPWQVSGVDLTKLQIFFQGSRVMVPEGASQALTLNEKPH